MYVRYGVASGAQNSGLLLLRLTLVGALVSDAIQLTSSRSGVAWVVLSTLLGACAIAAALGYKTRLVHAFLTGVGVIALAICVMRPSGPMNAVELLLLKTAIAAGIALCGPGAFSTDARLFGHREISIPPRRHEAD